MESAENDPFEVFLAIVPTVFLSFITVNLYPVFLKDKGWREKFIMDLTTLITPLLLAETIFADHLLLLNITLMVICVGIGIKNKSGRRVKSVKKNDDTVIRSCITNLRSTTSVLSIIAILAVDFTIFPSRFQKTDYYGFSLMDVGVGTFLVSNAMVAPETRGITTPPKKTLIGILILIALGLKRYFLLITFDYHVNVLEYGTHWNFFFTLAAAKTISATILATNKKNNMWTCGIKGLIVLIIHQTALFCSLESFVFSDAPRDDFFSANREGIVSSMGYAGLYLLEVTMSFQNNKKSTVKFLTTIILIAITSTLYIIFNVSRCVANITYCFWILLLSYVLRTLYFSIGEFMSRNYKDKTVPQTTFIFESINYNPLVFFMAANFMTGFVNLVFQTETFEPIASLFILIVYLGLNCLIVSVMYVKKIKLKC